MARSSQRCCTCRGMRPCCSARSVWKLSRQYPRLPHLHFRVIFTARHHAKNPAHRQSGFASRSMSWHQTNTDPGPLLGDSRVSKIRLQGQVWHLCPHIAEASDLNLMAWWKPPPMRLLPVPVLPINNLNGESARSHMKRVPFSDKGHGRSAYGLPGCNEHKDDEKPLVHGRSIFVNPPRSIMFLQLGASPAAQPACAKLPRADFSWACDWRNTPSAGMYPLPAQFLYRRSEHQALGAAETRCGHILQSRFYTGHIDPHERAALAGPAKLLLFNCIRDVDQSIGQVLGAPKTSGRDQDTIVILDRRSRVKWRGVRQTKLPAEGRRMLQGGIPGSTLSSATADIDYARRYPSLGSTVRYSADGLGWKLARYAPAAQATEALSATRPA